MSEEIIPYNPPGLDEYIREGARHNQRLLDKWKKEQASKTPEPSTLASATCYASWVIILNSGKEPVVKRCNSDADEKKMVNECKAMNPEAQIIVAQTNPADRNELWCCSENHWRAVNEA